MALSAAWASFSLTCPSGYAPITTATTTLWTTSSFPTASTTSTTSSLSSSSSRNGTSTSTATTSSSSSPIPSPVNNGTIQWIPCPQAKEENLQCGVLSVPLDWTDPSGQNLTLPMVRVPAKSTTPRNQTIFYNPGGPGISAISGFVGGGGTHMQTLYGDDWDMVAFDPRGVGLNMAYLCPAVTPSTNPETDDGDLDPKDFDVPDLMDPANIVPFSEAWWDTQYKSKVAQAQQCAEPAYNTAGQLVGSAFVARDINAMAEALGQDGYIRYMGYSYGTLLGATLAAMFPEKVDRVVLDGNINPTDYYHGLGDEAVADYDAALENFLDLCAEAGPTQCPLAHDDLTGEELLEEQWSFYHDLVNGTYTTHDANGNDIDFSDFQDIMQQVIFEGPLYWKGDVNKWAYAYQNRTAVPAAQRRATTPPFNPADAAVINRKQALALSAITCGDSDRFSDVNGAKFEEWQAIYNNRSQYGGETLSSILFSCATWLVNAKEKAPSFDGVVTKTPVLFVEGFYDPVTPSESARNSSAGFVGSGIQWHYGLGHCSSRDPSKQVIANVKSYLDTGVLPDLSTVAEPDSPAFPNLASTKVKRTSREDEEYEVAVAALAALANRASDPGFQYPDALRGAQRDVYELLRRDVPTSGPASGTASTTDATTTTILSSTTSSDAMIVSSAISSTTLTTASSVSSSYLTWTSSATTSSWSIPPWCTPIVPFSTTSTASSWTTTASSTKDAVSGNQTWLDWTATTTSAMSASQTTGSGIDPTWLGWTTSTSENTQSADPTWSDWAASIETGSSEPAWSDWTVSTTMVHLVDPTWSDWTTLTEPDSADPTWSDWAASTTSTSADPTWSDWTTLTETDSADPTWSDWAVSTTITPADPTWSDWTTLTETADPNWSDWTASTTGNPADPTWSDWTTATVTDPATWSDWDPSRTTTTDQTWSDWTSATISTGTIPSDPTWSDWSSLSSKTTTSTTTAVNPSWTDWSDPDASSGSWKQTTTTAGPSTSTDVISVMSVKPSTTTSAKPVDPWQTYTGAGSRNSACAMSIVAAVAVLVGYIGL